MTVHTQCLRNPFRDVHVSFTALCLGMIQDPNEEQEDGEEEEVEDGEEEVEDLVLPGQVLFSTQVETKGSDLTCRVSTHHATHHQIVII